MSEWKETIQKEMVVSRADTRMKLLNRAKKLIQIGDGGDIDFSLDTGRIKQSSRILLLLIGRWFAFEGGVVASDALAYREIVGMLGIPEGTVKNVLFRLQRSGYVEKVEEATFRVRYLRIERALVEIEKEAGS